MQNGKHVKNLEFLFETLRELVPERDLETLFQRVIKVSTQILGADRALLFLYDKKNDGLVFKYGVNIEEGLIEEAHQYSSSVIERAMKGEVIMTSDSQKGVESPTPKSTIEYDIRTILCAPILTDGRLIGVIYADTRGKTTFLDEERRSYFLSFVDFIANVIVGALDLHDKTDELSYLKRRLAEGTIFPEIVGRSTSISTVKEKVMRMAAVDYPVSVLILGESGTGKELIARAIHQAGSRSGKPFVVVNCAAIPVTLMESELFGHEKGAFTGALSRKQGFFEVADGGVIFLDEIGDLPLELQPKLLRVLQFGSFTRVGGRTELSSDVQVLCATSKDLYHEMERERFRKALFHRLAVEVVRVPSLRERKQDILLLADHFLSFFSDRMGKPVTGIDAEAQKLLKGHDYGGNNVRELKNVIERAVLTSDGKHITATDVVFSDDLLSDGKVNNIDPLRGEDVDSGLIQIDEVRFGQLLEESREVDDQEKREKPFYRVHEEIEKKLIILSLRHSGWKIKPASNLLGLSHVSLRSRLETILTEYFEACGGDLNEISRKYGIPNEFLKVRLGRPANDREGKTD